MSGPGTPCVGARPSVSGPALLLCVGARRSVSGPGALCVGARRFVSWPGSPLPALFVLGPGALCWTRRSLCRGPALLLCVGARRSVSGPSALCVGARRFVSGPGAPCVGDSSPKTLFVRSAVVCASGPGAFCRGLRGPAVGARRSVSGPGALCVGGPVLSVEVLSCQVWRFLSTCQAQRSVCRSPALFVLGRGALSVGARRFAGSTCHPSGTGLELRSASPASRRPPAKNCPKKRDRNSNNNRSNKISERDDVGTYVLSLFVAYVCTVSDSSTAPHVEICGAHANFPEPPALNTHVLLCVQALPTPKDKYLKRINVEGPGTKNQEPRLPRKVFVSNPGSKAQGMATSH